MTEEQAKKATDTLRLEITSTPEGIIVQAPGDGNFYNEPLSFWLLEKAKDHIKHSNARKAMEERTKKPGLYVPKR